MKKRPTTALLYLDLHRIIIGVFGVSPQRNSILHGGKRMKSKKANKTSILTPDPLRVQSVMTIQPSNQKSERALGQA